MPRSASPAPLRPVVEALESASALDGIAGKIGKVVRDAVPTGTVKDALSGTWLGHALHPLLTDVVIGSFLSATLLDLLGGDDDGRASERLLAIGLAAYGPTAATGANDWADSEAVVAPVRRVGLVHATSNATAFGLYAASLAARRRGDRGRGTLLSLGGMSALTIGGYLGAHMSYAQGVGPNQTAFDSGPDEWTEVDAGELEEGKPKAVVVEDTPVLLVRHSDHVHAIHDRCSHRGCSLAEGELDGEVIECSCHGSRFSLRDGSVQRGPATVPQPVYEVRESGGRLELRLPELG